MEIVELVISERDYYSFRSHFLNNYHYLGEGGGTHSIFSIITSSASILYSFLDYSQPQDWFPKFLKKKELIPIFLPGECFRVPTLQISSLQVDLEQNRKYFHQFTKNQVE